MDQPIVKPIIMTKTLAGLLIGCWCVLTTAQAAWQMKQAPIMTRWAALVDTNNPLPEYPRPQMVRSDWKNLNGLWQFQAGATNDAVPVGQTLASQILVPYPMESAISGVMKHNAFSWYRRTFTVPAAWSGKRVILHFEAVDWRAMVYVNGTQVGLHQGGYDPFSYDVTANLNGGNNELIVQVYDPVDDGGQPRGKQTLSPWWIMYTSSSGIWQPVWLEPVDAAGVSDLKLVPDVDHAQLRLTVNTYATNGVTVQATVSSNGVTVSSVTGNPQTELSVAVPKANLWSPDNPFLYDLNISVLQGGVTNDTVTSYFGMRKISVQTVNGVPQMFLNNQPCFQMGTLDQGFWPDGLYTAPTDEALKFDLEQHKAMGFNLVRKHIKVERQRWYYWADKLGLLVWQDMPSCNSYTMWPVAVDPNQFIAELTNMVATHWNSPAIILWVTFNEGQGQTSTGQTNTPYLVQLVKNLDPTRLVNQASGGGYYGVGDIFDNHNYPHPGSPFSSTLVPVDGEYGGIGFQAPGHLWDEGKAAFNALTYSTNDIAPLYDSFCEELVTYKAKQGLNAAVYTQITDVEDEINGLMTYDRAILKPDLNLIRLANKKAIEGYRYYSPVLPSSETAGRAWTYTTTPPAANWMANSFNDSAWSNGVAGFGGGLTSVIRTKWTASDIWLRQGFKAGPLTPADRSRLAFSLFHDEACEIYLNGVLAGSATGYNATYGIFAMNAAGQQALISNGTNIIAVHCRNTTGGQDIDVGIVRENLVVDWPAVPTDYAEYWPLNEAAGAVAEDAIGNRNPGTVNNAAWSAAGKLNGCLTFNGSNSYGQVNRTISNDFSLSFWVKTTQTGGTGQWYNGKGLVDGEVFGVANDFGTALVGNQFAFGTGNPDVTILATTAINDGAWHHCVATRQQATGTLRVYVDGTLQNSGTGSTNALTSATRLRLGGILTGGNFFNGSLDDVKTFPRALGSNEVAALYADGAAWPAAPANFTAQAGYRRVALNWSAPPFVTGYDLKRATRNGGPYAPIASLTTPYYTDTAVTNGITYYYVVTAGNGQGSSANSAQVIATPSLSGVLATWLKADNLAGLANNAAIANWQDASGNGNNATQSTAGWRPTYRTNVINGLPAVRFNAANKTYLATPSSAPEDFTLLCVFRSTQGSGTGSLYYQGAGLISGEVSGTMLDFGTCLFADGRVCAGTGDADVAVVSTNGFNDGSAHLMTFKRTAQTGRTDLYVDGVAMGYTNGNQCALLAPSRLVLGAQQVLNNYFTGDLAELKIYRAALVNSDRADQETILAAKWGTPLAGQAVVVETNAPVRLTASASAAALVVSWPLSAMGAQLYYATNLTSPVHWQSVTNPLDSDGVNFSVTLPTQEEQGFYQLVTPPQ